MPPNIYTISAERPFLATLADGLLETAGEDPLRLSRITVLLPTRRAVRSLRDAFLRTGGPGGEAGAPLLLPQMRAVGDLGEDGIELSGIGEGPGADPLGVPPAVPELRRRLLLTQLVLRWSERRGTDRLLPGQAAALATALARFLDAVETEGASFERLRDLAPESLARHWQTVLAFLNILPTSWPGVLAAEGAIDAAERRNRLLRRQAAAWRRAPPRGPVIAAGLSGGIPAVEELIEAVAALDAGTVILVGLDRSCGPAVWRAIEEDEAHPQHLTAMLLRRLERLPEDVREWRPEIGAPTDQRRARRLRLVAQALRPAPLTDAWRGLAPETSDALDGVSRYDCPNSHDEAVTIALLLRRKLETPDATAALVTPDRELARRVAAELRRWGIEIDDSAGLPLGRTPPGVFLRLVADAAASTLAPVPLLALLKQPLAAGGIKPEAFRDLARRLDLRLRGPRPAPGFAGLAATLGAERNALGGFIARLRDCLAPFADILRRADTRLVDLVEAHVTAAERLAATENERGPARLWQEPAGEAAARFCHELLAAAPDFPVLPGRDYPALFEALANGFVVRPAFGNHPRLAIWGLLEARLQQADLLVLGGLNEGTWPSAAAHDPWMSREMRRDFRLAPPERSVGIAAQDFALAIGAPEIALVRTARREGAPTVPSRWLLRLDAVLRAVELDGALAAEREIGAAAAMLDEPALYRPIAPPAPRPPLAARPRRLSVTQVETWFRDPYAIYARHILGLHAEEELDADPGRAELGSRVHQALDAFLRQFPRDLPADAEAELVRIGRETFGPILSRPGVRAFWWPRFERIAQWLAAEERVWRRELVQSLSECEGKLELAGPAGRFTVTAKADRIDRLATGGFVVIDYKTGAIPPKKDREAAVAVQLPLEGAILRDGSFDGVSGCPERLEYWRLTGGDPPGQRCPVSSDDPAMLIDRVLARLRRMIDRFDDPATPYLATPHTRWQPRFSDYRHLERLDEAELEE